MMCFLRADARTFYKVGGYLSKMRAAHGRRGHIMNDLMDKIHPLEQEAWDEAFPSTKNVYLNGKYAEKNFPGLLGKATNLSRYVCL